MAKLKVGDIAPDFSLPNQDNESVSLDQFRGKKHLVLYFYPKDESPGCVMEACSFRDNYEAFTDAGAEVIGVSRNGKTSHQAFIQNRKLPFQLLSDKKGQVHDLYGVEKALMGLIYRRETFVIDKNGVIQMHFSSQLNINGHIKDALKVIEGLD